MSLFPGICGEDQRCRGLWRRAVALVLLGLAGGLAYSNSFRNALVLDDLGNIVRNSGIRRLWPLSAALQPPKGPIGFWTRPITNLTFAWDYAHSETDVAGYRRTNLMLHLVAGGLLYLLLGNLLSRRRPGGELRAGTDPALPDVSLRDGCRDGAPAAAFAAALLWLVHPLNTAAVNYLSQRGEILVALFLFSMLYALQKAGESPPGQGWGWQVAAVGSCLLGMGSKENMLAAPLLALLFDRLFLADSWRELMRRRGLMHAGLWMTVLWPIHRQWVYSPHATLGLTGEVRGQYLLTQCQGVAHMIRLSFWPDPLVFYYGKDLVGHPGEVWPQALLLAALVAGTLWGLRRRSLAGFAGAFFFGVLAPSSTVVPILGQPIAEHRMYAPLAAGLALVAGGIFRAALRCCGRRALPVVLGGVLGVAAGWGVATYRRNADYRTPLVLWANTVQKRPACPEARQDLANALREAGNPEAALGQYTEALRLRPDYVDAHFNRGTLLSQLGRSGEAIGHFREALRLKPESPQIEETLGAEYLRAGRPAEALEYLEIAYPKLAEPARILVQMVQALTELDRGEEAEERLRAVRSARPGDASLDNALGVLLCRLGRPGEAVTILQAAVAADPENPRTRYNLGRALRDAGRSPPAGEHLGTAAEDGEAVGAEPASNLLDY